MAAVESVLEPRRVVARRASDALAVHPTVSAVLVFGSVALGHVDERSDVDILVVCRDELPSLDDCAALLTRLGRGWSTNAEGNPLFGRCDSGGAVDGIAVDLHYQTASLINSVLSQVIEHGAITTAEVPFRPYTLAALIQRAWVLLDKDGLVQHWRQYIASYPEVLKKNILQHFSPVLRESTEDLLSNAERHLGPVNFIFFLNSAVDAMVNILFALNDMYDPSERRTERVILPTLKRVPEDFIARLTDVLEGPFDDAGALYRARLFDTLADDVLKLAQPYVA